MEKLTEQQLKEHKDNEKKAILHRLIELIEQNNKPKPKKPRKKADPKEDDAPKKPKAKAKKTVDDDIQAKINEKLFLQPPKKKPQQKKEEVQQDTIKMEIMERINQKDTPKSQPIIENNEMDEEMATTIQEVAQEVAESYAPIVQESKVSSINSFLMSYKNKYM